MTKRWGNPLGINGRNRLHHGDRVRLEKPPFYDWEKFEGAEGKIMEQVAVPWLRIIMDDGRVLIAPVDALTKIKEANHESTRVRA